MTPTIKEPLESTSPATPGTSSANSENKPGESGRPNPVCLEVGVTVRSLPGENGGAPGSNAPIREEGRTVIVFDNGAVLRLSNNLPSGQKVILSNAQGRDVVCRVVKGPNLPTVKGYIEVEFIEPVNDFWRIHQTPEPVSVARPAAPILASATPIPVVPQAAPPVVPRLAEPEKEAGSPLGNAPTFEDIAGLVRMAPSPGASSRTKDPTAQMGALKSRTDVRSSQGDLAKTPPAIEAPLPISEVPSMNRAIPAAQEFSSFPVQKQASTNDFMARGMLASGQLSSSPSPSAFRKRLPLIIGGAALVLAGFGGGFFFMHQGSAPTPAASAPVVTQSSAQPAPAQSSEAAPVQMSQAAPEQVPAQPQTLSANASASSESAVSNPNDAANLRRAANNPEPKQPDRTVKQRPALPNLKMSSPTAPRQNLAKLPEGSAPNVTDVSSAVAVGAAPSATMLSPVVRSANPPAPPTALAPTAPSAKSVREPRLISSTHPTYPSVARQSHTEGTVVVTAQVDARGNVTGAKAISGPVSLRPAAAEAVSQWKYAPALIDGQPASSQVTINVQFRLN